MTGMRIAADPAESWCIRRQPLGLGFVHLNPHQQASQVGKDHEPGIARGGDFAGGGAHRSHVGGARRVGSGGLRV